VLKGDPRVCHVARQPVRRRRGAPPRPPQGDVVRRQGSPNPLDTLGALVRLGGAGVPAEQHGRVDPQHGGDVLDGGDPVEGAHAAFDLVHPALRLAEPVGEKLLRHPPSNPPVRHPPANRQQLTVVHDAAARPAPPG
jgi:hypothetical protein